MVGVSTMTNPAMEWLDARGLDIELAAKMGWECVRHRELGLALKIPYYRDEKVVTTQYRALDKKEFRLAQGAEIELWNRDVLKDVGGRTLVIAEGACDGLALVQCGYPHTVAVPGWSDKNYEPDNYKPFTSNEAMISTAKRIVVAQHNDNAGATMLRAVANFFDECSVAYVRWPADCKDANDCLLKHGPSAVVQAISTAKEVDPPGGLITGFSDLPPRPERHIWRLDYPELDRVMAFRSRAISVITGTPGSGKTTMATWVSHHLVRANGIRIGMGLFETDGEEVLMQLARLRGKQPEYMTERDWVETRAELDKHYRLMHRVEDNETMHGVSWLKSMIHKLAARDNCAVIFIDPWNELEHVMEPGESITNYTNYALTKLRQWAEKYDVHICIIAHPRKLQDGERPSGYHISDSAAWANKVDMGWTVHVEKESETDPEHVSLTCWKVRSRQSTGCRPGRERLLFDEYAMSYRPKPKSMIRAVEAL
jgi:twinkle protein